MKYKMKYTLPSFDNRVKMTESGTESDVVITIATDGTKKITFTFQAHFIKLMSLYTVKNIFQS